MARKMAQYNTRHCDLIEPFSHRVDDCVSKGATGKWLGVLEGWWPVAERSKKGSFSHQEAGEKKGPCSPVALLGQRQTMSEGSNTVLGKLFT